VSFYLVEETQPGRAKWFTDGEGRQHVVEARAHKIWRCGHCKALAVGPITAPAPAKCGRCKL
jgi:hypothetical protein